MSRDTELLTEIRDLLEAIAEPALAKRDAKKRAALRSIIGKSDKRTKAVSVMDGSRSQSTIAKESGLDAGNLSRLVKALAEAKLISSDAKSPKLILKLPAAFFEETESDE